MQGGGHFGALAPSYPADGPTCLPPGLLCICAPSLIPGPLTAEALAPPVPSLVACFSAQQLGQKLSVVNLYAAHGSMCCLCGVLGMGTCLQKRDQLLAPYFRIARFGDTSYQIASIGSVHAVRRRKVGDYR